MCRVKNLRAYEAASSSLLSFFVLFILLAALFFIPIADAQSSVSLYYFSGEDCLH